MKRLVHHTNPEARVTPLILLASLRDIDPLVELVYAGERIWWLGAVRPNEVRAKKGQFILDQMLALDNHHHERPTIARNIMLGKLAIQGFALIERYDDHGDPAGRVTVAAGTPSEYDCNMVEDFRERDAAWRRDGGERNAQAKLDHALGKHIEAEAQAQFDQYLAADGRDHYRREVRNRVQFGYAGQTGGGGHPLILTP